MNKYYAHATRNYYACQTPTKIVGIDASEEASIVIFDDSNGLYNLDDFKEIPKATFQEQYQRALNYVDSVINPKDEALINKVKTD